MLRPQAGHSEEQSDKESGFWFLISGPAVRWLRLGRLIHEKFQVDHPGNHGEDEDGVSDMHPDGEDGVVLALRPRFRFLVSHTFMLLNTPVRVHSVAGGVVHMLCHSGAGGFGAVTFDVHALA